VIFVPFFLFVLILGGYFYILRIFTFLESDTKNIAILQFLTQKYFSFLTAFKNLCEIFLEPSLQIFQLFTFWGYFELCFLNHIA